jgi:hypothetical protein
MLRAMSVSFSYMLGKNEFGKEVNESHCSDDDIHNEYVQPLQPYSYLVKECISRMHALQHANMIAIGLAATQSPAFSLFSFQTSTPITPSVLTISGQAKYIFNCSQLHIG